MPDKTDIEQMLELISDLRDLLEDFDFEEHTDAGNEAHQKQAVAALDALEGHVNDLVA
jgi:hypothetical protein